MFANAKTSPNEASYDEIKFIDHLQSIKECKGFGGLHIRLSKLIKDPINSQSYQVGLRTFEKFTQHTDSKLFKFRSGDLFYIFHLTELDDVQKIALKLKDIFGNSSETSSLASVDIYKIYNLLVDFDDVFFLAQNILERIGLGAYCNKFKEDIAREPLTPGKLEKLETALENVNLSTFLRQQPICVIMNNKIVKTILREFYVSLPDFQKQVIPKTNLTSDFWLFRYLTRLLNKRILSSLEQSGQKIFDSAFCLNLSVETILSSQFMRFDRNIKASTRGTIVIEVDLADVYADIGSFLSARQYLKDHQYKLCLSGLTLKSLPFINREMLDVDLLKLIWNTNFNENENATIVKKYVNSIGSERFILYHCDSYISVETGQKLGFTLYQGRYVQLIGDKK
ncbi:MAG: hypothetical protein Q8L85_03110 [Alphaproteobacteria bacterium]|nr:hypothetical protein [Alphaproteobacteria bacterium]